MHERLKTPEEAYRYKLGAAVTMEGIVLMVLGSCVADARGERVKAMFAEQLDESQDHARNVEECSGCSAGCSRTSLRR
jgi:ferritin-like metal-binding protein YciE